MSTPSAPAPTPPAPGQASPEQSSPEQAASSAPASRRATLAAFGSGTLRGRVSLVLTALFAIILLIVASAWARETREAIHEEIQAATRVAEQWLTVLIAETLPDGPDAQERLMGHLVAVGRIRANRLEVLDAGRQPLYVSPEPTYKAGRFAPTWFTRAVAPPLPPREFAAGERIIRLVPDTSRSVLDAWDRLVAATGWAAALLALIWFVTQVAVNRALAPLREIDSALARGAEGKFDARLPVYPVRELDLIARSYNRLADSLDQSRARNARLEEDQVFAHALQLRLEEERRLIARELHDELGQGVTAVRAIAGAIMQRTEDQPNLHGSAQAILAMTGQMQEGVRSILQRLRHGDAGPGVTLEQAVARYCKLWSARHPDIALVCRIEALPAPTSDAVGLAVLRLLQESLTNVVRHARANQVEISLRPDDDGIELCVADNGCGLTGTMPGNRFGLLGMRERVGELHGHLRFLSPPGGGLKVCAHLPLADSMEHRA